MKVKNTSKHVIKLPNGKAKVTLIPGTGDVYDVSDSADVQAMIASGELIEAPAGKRAKAAAQKDDSEKAPAGDASAGDGDAGK